MTEVCHKCKVRITRFGTHFWHVKLFFVLCNIVDMIEHSKICTGDPSLYKKPSLREINRYFCPFRFYVLTRRARKEEELVSFKCVHCQCPFDHVDDLEVHMLTDHPELLEGTVENLSLFRIDSLGAL
jgi:hypothetical protein